MCVCVCERERERERERVCVRERERERECVCVRRSPFRELQADFSHLSFSLPLKGLLEGTLTSRQL